MAHRKHNQNEQSDERQNDARQRVEHAVAQALQAQIPHLHSEIVRQVLEAMPLSASPAPAREDSSALVQAVSNIHAGSTQKEILRALLDAGSGYCSRIALFVVKAGAASGWQSRGFDDEETAKDFALDMNAGPVAAAYQNRVATPGNIAEMDARFVKHFGSPSDEHVLVLPLALKDKVAALVYADGGNGGKLDSSALELLVIATSSWLEVASLRKQASVKEDAVAPSHTETGRRPCKLFPRFPIPSPPTLPNTCLPAASPNLPRQ